MSPKRKFVLPLTAPQASVIPTFSLVFCIAGFYCAPSGDVERPVGSSNQSLERYAREMSPSQDFGLHGFSQITPKSRELAKAVCKTHCLKDCVQTLRSKAMKEAAVCWDWDWYWDRFAARSKTGVLAFAANNEAGRFVEDF
ncbi:unnamed protein product [Schistocephalus solidus]|uniref:Apple domain-containing protein n=1 Tax=Schistocephalus solidus TaxID=70667 RepID=A0A183SD61_SCHSO|nr:unnamed protein product [Schistocephalus solidus]